MDTGFNLNVLFSTFFGILLLSVLTGKEHYRVTLQDFISIRLLASACFLISILSLAAIAAYILGAKNEHFMRGIGGLLNFSYGTFISVVLAKGILVPSSLKRGYLPLIVATVFMSFTNSLPFLEAQCISYFDLCKYEDQAANSISYIMIIFTLVVVSYGYWKFVIPKLGKYTL